MLVISLNSKKELFKPFDPQIKAISRESCILAVLQIILRQVRLDSLLQQESLLPAKFTA